MHLTIDNSIKRRCDGNTLKIAIIINIFNIFIIFNIINIVIIYNIITLQGSTLWAVENKNIIAISSTLSKPQQPKPGRETMSPDRLDLRTCPAGQISALGKAAPSLWAQIRLRRPRGIVSIRALCLPLCLHFVDPPVLIVVRWWSFCPPR